VIPDPRILAMIQRALRAILPAALVCLNAHSSNFGLIVFLEFTLGHDTAIWLTCRWGWATNQPVKPFRPAASRACRRS
jgi:hypothetical protein